MSFNFDLGISSRHIPYNVLPWCSIVQSRVVARQSAKEQPSSTYRQIWLDILSFLRRRGKIFSGGAVKRWVFSKVFGKLLKQVADLTLVNYIREVISLTLATETKLTNQTKQGQWRLLYHSVGRYKILEAKKNDKVMVLLYSCCIRSTLFSSRCFFSILRL